MANFKRLLPTAVILIVELAVGILLLINGEKFTQMIFLLIGIILLACGVYTLIRALIESRKEGNTPVMKIVLAVILLAVGVFFTAASGSVASILSTVVLIFGIILAFSGMLKLAEFLSIRKSGSVSGLALISSVVTIILGVVIAFNPFGATKALWTILGIMIIASAATDIVSLVLFRKAIKNATVKSNMIDVEAVDIDD